MKAARTLLLNINNNKLRKLMNYEINFSMMKNFCKTVKTILLLTFTVSLLCLCCSELILVTIIFSLSECLHHLNSDSQQQRLFCYEFQYCLTIKQVSEF